MLERNNSISGVNQVDPLTSSIPGLDSGFDSINSSLNISRSRGGVGSSYSSFDLDLPSQARLVISNFELNDWINPSDKVASPTSSASQGWKAIEQPAGGVVANVPKDILTGLPSDKVESQNHKSGENQDILTGSKIKNPQVEPITPNGAESSAYIESMAEDTPIKDPLLGIYYGNEGWKMDQVKALETWQGKKHAVVNMFTNWDSSSTVVNNLFQQQLPNIWNNQNVPMISWEPFTGGTTATNIEVAIASGQYNTYINQWADQLKTFLSGSDKIYGTSDDRRAYLRFAHEMNGDWYPWSAVQGNNNPKDYVNMWQHTKGIFDSKGLDSARLQWVWCVNNTDVGAYKAEEYYPGNDYVDWVAIDGYNWGTSQSWSSWQTPDQVFGDMINRLNALTSYDPLTNTTGLKPKPIGITEVGSTSLTSSGRSISAKSQWTTNLLNYAVDSGIKMVSWFNQDKETDWAIFGGAYGDSSVKVGKTTYKNYTAYKTGITPISYSGSDPSNPRLLSDEFFKGEMA